MSFTRRMKRQQQQKMFREKTLPLSAAQGDRIEELLTKAKQEGYTEGVRSGVERATRYAVSAWESGVRATKGVGQKTLDAILHNVQEKFRVESDFAQYDNPVSQEIFELRVVRKEEAMFLKQLDTLISTYKSVALTRDDILSILNTFFDTQDIIDRLLTIHTEGRGASAEEAPSQITSGDASVNEG